MIFGINAGLSGLNASAERMRTAANNLANLNTPGYKRQETVVQSAGQNRGVIVSAARQNNTSGNLLFSGRRLDISMQGNNFLKVLTPSGDTAYTRRGELRTDSQSRLTDGFGNRLQPEIKIPADAEQVAVSGDGKVTAQINGQKTVLGQIELTSFSNPSRLTSGGSGLFFESDSSGTPVAGRPAALGRLIPNSTESSNVDIASEIIELIKAKHAFKANATVIKTSGEMLGSTLNIKA